MVHIRIENNIRDSKKNSIISWRNYSKESLIENLKKCNWCDFEITESKFTKICEATN